MSALDLPPPGDPLTCYVVDLSDWTAGAYRRAAPVRAPNGERVELVRHFGQRLRWFMRSRAPRFAVFCGDLAGATLTRRGTWAGYRLGKEPPAEAYTEQLDRIVGLLELHRLTVVQGLGCEGDDWIATMTAKALTFGLKVVIITHAHTPWQLVRRGSVWVYGGDENHDGEPTGVVGPDEVLARYGVVPEYLRELWALSGKGDEAPGIDGIGAKKAVALLKRMGSLDEVIRKASWLGGADAIRVRDGASDARMSRELLKLTTTAPNDVIPWDLCVGWDRDRAQRIRTVAVELGLQAMTDVATLDPIPMPSSVLEAYTQLEGGPPPSDRMMG